MLDRFIKMLKDNERRNRLKPRTWKNDCMDLFVIGYPILLLSLYFIIPEVKPIFQKALPYDILYLAFILIISPYIITPIGSLIQRARGKTID